MSSDRSGDKEQDGCPAIAPPRGKLGIMIPGMGAVATTFVAGVEAVRKGISSPIGSLTQMGTIRLGKRTEGRSPKIKDFVPLAGLNDLVFTGWDIFEDDMYAAAGKAGVLDRSLLEQVKPFLSSIKPRKAVFDKNYVKKLDGPNVKKGKNKMELAEQVRDDIREFKQIERRRPSGDDLVRFDRDVHQSRRRCIRRSKRSRRRCMPTTRTLRLR